MPFATSFVSTFAFGETRRHLHAAGHCPLSSGCRDLLRCRIIQVRHKGETAKLEASLSIAIRP